MIFCVEDDAGIRNMMTYTLNSSGFEAEGFSDGSEFFAALEKSIPDLVILDIMLPGDDGLVILSKLRSQSATADVPVIMATAKGTEFDKIVGLDMGADDYLAKPFGMMEMVSRVKAVLRRTQTSQSTPLLKVDGLIVNQDEYTVMVDGKRVQLTYKEFELLCIFLSHPGLVYTREQLFAKVWKTDYMGDSRTLDSHIRTLRQKLGDYGKMIETVRNVGYRWEVGYDK